MAGDEDGDGVEERRALKEGKIARYILIFYSNGLLCNTPESGGRSIPVVGLFHDAMQLKRLNETC